jgi:hypothetical protein
MNKLTKILINSSACALFGISGCNLNVGGGREYVNLNKSPYVSTFQEKAVKIDEELSNENYPSKAYRLKSLKDAVGLHGGLGNLDLMDKYIKEIIFLNPEVGEIYSEVGLKYHNLHKNKR